MSQNIAEIKKNAVHNINEALASRFRGTASYYVWSPLFPKSYLTDGTKYVAESLECFWLFDVIASYQVHPKVKEESIQFWSIEAEDGRAVVKVERDADQPIVEQVIDYTTFPDGRLKIWAEKCKYPNGDNFFVMYLPSEY